MKNPKYHIYLTPDERRTVISSLIDLRNDLISWGKYTDIIDELLIKLTKAKVNKISRSRRSELWLQRLHIRNRVIIFCPI